MKFKIYARINGQPKKGQTDASSMAEAVRVVCDHFGLAAPPTDFATSAEVMHLNAGSNFVEIAMVGSKQKRAARLSL